MKEGRERKREKDKDRERKRKKEREREEETERKRDNIEVDLDAIETPKTHSHSSSFSSQFLIARFTAMMWLSTKKSNELLLSRGMVAHRDEIRKVSVCLLLYHFCRKSYAQIQFGF